MATRVSIDGNPTKTRRRFTAQLKAEAVELCLQECLSCNAVAQRLALSSSSLSRWVRQARIVRGQAGPRDQGLLASEERAELSRLRKEVRELRRGKDCFRLAAAHFAKEQLSPKGSPDRSAGRAALRLLAVPSAGRGPQWLPRLAAAAGGAGKRAMENAVITAEIEAVFQEHRGFYGSPRIRQQLRASEHHVSRHRVARLMRRVQLRARTQKVFRPCSKASAEAAEVVEHLLQQDFKPPAPNRCWVGDITYIRTTEGWRCLAVWINLFSRRVVGWTLDQRMDAALVIEALNRALGHREVAPEQLLLHTDQGSHYRAS